MPCRDEYAWYRDVREDLLRLPAVAPKRVSTVTQANPQTKGRLVDVFSCLVILGFVALWFAGMLWLSN